LSMSRSGFQSRIVATGGRIAGVGGVIVSATLRTKYQNALAEFDAVSAPPVEVDAVDYYSPGRGFAFAMSPGQVIRLTGKHFGPPLVQGGTVAGGRVGSSINGLSVTFDGVPAPLLTLQDQSIELVVPFEVQQYNTVMQVLQNGVPVSNPVTLPVVGLNADVLLVLNSDGTVNSADHPAPRGSTL